MSAGDILDRGLKLLFARLPTFYLINLIVLTPALLFQLALPQLMAQSPATVVTSGLIVLVLNMVLSTIGSAACLHVIAQEFIDGNVGVGESLAFAFSRFGSLLWASILFTIALSCGLMLLIVPGIIVLCWYILYSQVIVVEGLGANKSFTRSQHLTQGYRLRLLGVLILVGIAYLVATGGLEFALERLLPSQETVFTQVGQNRVPVQVTANYTNYVIQVILKYLVNILLSTYFSICVTLFYF